MLLEVNNLSVSYPEFTLHPVSFALDAGEMLTIVGESGSGKTTLARAIACLSEPEAQVSGQVYLNGRELLVEYADGRCCNFANSRKDLLDWLKLLKDEQIVDIRKIYKSGVTDSVLDNYRRYLKQ